MGHHIGTEAAAETTKQIITLSTGLIALTITFADKFKPEGTEVLASSALMYSWLAFGAAIFFGVWTMMAITGVANAAALAKKIPDSNEPSIRIPACLMVVAFIVGMACAIAAGFGKFN